MLKESFRAGNVSAMHMVLHDVNRQLKPLAIRRAESLFDIHSNLKCLSVPKAGLATPVGS